MVTLEQQYKRITVGHLHWYLQLWPLVYNGSWHVMLVNELEEVYSEQRKKIIRNIQPAKNLGRGRWGLLPRCIHSGYELFTAAETWLARGVWLLANSRELCCCSLIITAFHNSLPEIRGPPLSPPPFQHIHSVMAELGPVKLVLEC